MGLISILFPEDGARLPFTGAVLCFGTSEVGIDPTKLIAALYNDDLNLKVTEHPILDNDLLTALGANWFFHFRDLDQKFSGQPVELTVEEPTTHSRAHHRFRWTRAVPRPRGAYGPDLRINYPAAPYPATVSRTFACAGSVGPSNVTMSACLFNANGNPSTISGTLMSGPQPLGSWSYQFVVPNPWGTATGGQVIVQATDTGGYTSSQTIQVSF